MARRMRSSSQPLALSIEQAQAAGKHPDKKWSAASTIDADAKSAEWGWAILPDVKKPQQLQLKLREAAQLHAGDQLIIEMQQKHSNPGHILGSFRWSSSSQPLSFEAPLGASPLTELLASSSNQRQIEKPSK